jgi:hypothetical protein
MYYRGIRFNINQERNQVRDTIKKWRIRQCPVHQGRTTPNQTLLGKMEARSAIIHRTIRWGSGATALCTTTVTCHDEHCKSEVRAQKSEGTGLSGVATDYQVQLEDKHLQRSTAQNPNGCADVARTGLSDASIASRIQPTARSGWEAINTPNHLIHYHPSILNSSFIARAKVQHSKRQSKQSIHSKPQNQL